MACNCSTGRSAPQIPADNPTKHTGRLMKLSGNFSISMKYFSTPGTLPLYSGETTCKPAERKIASEKGSNDFGLSLYEVGGKISGGRCARSSTWSGTLSAA